MLLHANAKLGLAGRLALVRAIEDGLDASTPLSEATNGFAGASSGGLTQLDAGHTLSTTYTDASNGNLVQTARLSPGGGTFTLVLGFGSAQAAAVQAAEGSLAAGFPAARKSYEAGWAAYDAGLNTPPAKLSGFANPRWHDLVDAYYLNANVVKASEDKTFPGAIVASLTSPWGQAVSAGDPNNTYFGSYREVFSRDLYVRLVRGTRRPRTGYFLRAESFFNVATNIEELDEGQGGPPLIDSYGGVSLHEQSHGESFLSLILNRFGSDGLYVLDEPEAALSLRGNLALMRRMHDLVAEGSQFVVSTHSPILLGYPQARIYVLSEDGIEESRYENTEQYELTRSFLDDRDRFLHHLFADG